MLRNVLFTVAATLLAAQAPVPTIAPAHPAARPDPEAVLARIGDRIIKESEFEAFIAKSIDHHQQTKMEAIPGGVDKARQRFLDMTVMLTKARKDGLDRDSDFLQRLEQAKSQMLLQEFLKGVGADLEKKATTNDAEVKAYFEAHQEQFRTPESFSARQILVSVKGGPSAGANAPSEEEAKAKALAAAKALEAGKSWEEVAKAYSDDPGSSARGGLYENIAFGTFMPEFEEAVRKQALGKVGEPVKSKFGFHVIQVETRTPSQLPTFEEVKEVVRPKAVDAKRAEVFQAYLEGLKKEIGFEVSPIEVKPSVPMLAKPVDK